MAKELKKGEGRGYKGCMEKQKKEGEREGAGPASGVGVEYWERVLSEQRERIESQEDQIEELKGVVKKQVEENEELKGVVKKQAERIEQLEEEVRVLKKLKGKPKLKASRLGKGFGEKEEGGKRAGSEKRSKKATFEVDREEKIEPKELPDGSKFNKYREYDVQELSIGRANIRFKLGEYVTPEGKLVVGEVPEEYRVGHYGPQLRGYVLYQHWQCRVPQGLIYEQLLEWGIDISEGQLSRLLVESAEAFEGEQQAVLKAGLETVSCIQVDDTSARHQGKNGVCTVVSHPSFTHFESTGSKSRVNFLKVLQGKELHYVLNEESQEYLTGRLSVKNLGLLPFSEALLAESAEAWESYLTELGITQVEARKDVTEAALLGGLLCQGLNRDLVILSDGARQFNLFQHALCWIHAERPLRKLEGETDLQRANLTLMQTELWAFYKRLKDFCQNPSEALKASLCQDFDQTFGQVFEQHSALNEVLAQFRSYKPELLLVLDVPDIPLHNNAAETDIREFVIRRKISGGTRSNLGRRARDIFVGLKKTCRKLGVSFWHFLRSRLTFDDAVPPLPDLIRAKNSLPLPA
jgi:hypothetical protein